jgi:hypothetical protein
MNRPKRLLLLSNSELGQANVFLAVSHALMMTDANVEIHIASYPALKKSVTATSAFAQELNPKARPIIFHAINALSSVDAMAQNPEVDVPWLIEMKPSIWNIPAGLKIISRVAMPYTGPQLVDNYQEIERIVRAVEPDLSAVDSLYTIGLTVLHSLGTKFVVLTPNTLKEWLLTMQPRGAIFWKYPW